MTIDKRPIGVFDSGIGGLTVVRELRKQLPNESIIYFGDTARVPYGNKSPEMVTRYAKEATYILLQYDIKAFVVACNTASAHAIDKLKEHFSIPIYGVIQPGVERALGVTKNKKILVIGTSGTIRSNAYQRRLKDSGNGLDIFQKACPLFVPLVEEGWLNNEITRSIIAEYLDPYKAQDIDTVILGCTHYPILKSAIREFWPMAELVDSGVETARKLKRDLDKSLLKSDESVGNCKFFVSDIAENFQEIGQMFLGTKMEHFEVFDVENFFMENKQLFE